MYRVALIRLPALVAAVFSASLSFAQTQPKPLQTPSPEYPAAAQQAGHQGTVYVQMTIQEDGSTSAISLAQSSRSEELDKAALSAVATWKFSPATDAEGKLRSVTARVPLQFDMSSSAEFTQKLCKQFTVETKWFQQAFPEKKLSDTLLYKRTLGFLVIASTDMIGLAKRYDDVYGKALSECEANPEKQFWAVLSSNAR